MSVADIVRMINSFLCRSSFLVVLSLTVALAWASANTAVATTTGSGLAAGVAPGSTTIQATSGLISGSTSLTVTAPVSVDLNWDPSTSVVVGYNLYRGTQSGGPYAQLNSQLISTTTYTDGTVQAGQTYFYVATAVDSNNVESDFSNEVSITIPIPILSGGQTVTQASTRAAISSLNASSVVSEPVTFTISVADSSAGTTRFLAAPQRFRTVAHRSAS